MAKNHGRKFPVPKSLPKAYKSPNLVTLLVIHLIFEFFTSQHFFNLGNPAVHHVGRRYNVRAGLGEIQGDGGNPLETRLVLDKASGRVDDATVAVGAVRAEADVASDQKGIAKPRADLLYRDSSRVFRTCSG